MFDIFTKSVESTLNIVDDVFEGEAPKKKDIAKVADTALTMWAASEVIDTLSSLLEDD